MTILKKIASLLLSLAIVITVLPTAALASALDFGSEVSPIDMVDFDTIGWIICIEFERKRKMYTL